MYFVINTNSLAPKKENVATC